MMTPRTRRDAPWLALALLLCVATVGFIDRIIVNVLVEPIKDEFGLSDTQVSLMGAAFALLNVVVGIVAARFAERVVRVNLIAFGTFAWSVATGICGIATSWVQLLVARMGVGLAESIGLAGNQSVLSDYFPARRRGLAISILLLSPPLGALIGFVGGGLVAQELGWRATFIVAAIPGIVIAAAVWLFVAEPTRGQHDTESADDLPSFRDVLVRFWRVRSARQLVIGGALAAMFAFALNYFFTSMLMRRFGLPIGEAAIYAGLIASIPALFSVVFCGWLGDRIGPRSPAAYALIPGIFLAIGGPLLAFGLTRDSLEMLLAFVALASFFNLGFLGITYAAIQNLMHPRMRATASALLNGIYSFAGALGPFLVGMLSDRLALVYDPGRGLAYALAIAAALCVWSALHYGLAARHLPKDLEGRL